MDKITHKCKEFKIIEIFPGHILGDRITGVRMRDDNKIHWFIQDDVYASELIDRKCPFCKIELDTLLNADTKT